MNRSIGDTVYINNWPYPIKAVIVTPAMFKWSLHTVMREDLTHNTMTLERDLVSEEYALYMKSLHDKENTNHESNRQSK